MYGNVKRDKGTMLAGQRRKALEDGVCSAIWNYHFGGSSFFLISALAVFDGRLTDEGKHAHPATSL